MKYRVGTILKPFLGDSWGEIIEIDDERNRYIVKWQDKDGYRAHDERHMREIILIAHYKAIEPDILPEELFEL